MQNQPPSLSYYPGLHTAHQDFSQKIVYVHSAPAASLSIPISLSGPCRTRCREQPFFQLHNTPSPIQIGVGSLSGLCRSSAKRFLAS